jgi:predicted phosphate transport protein (TIGR00153 family)
MNKVADCVQKVTEIFDALHRGDQATVEKLVAETSELEHAADLTKNDIRNNLPKGLFLPVDRSVILEILAIQDHIADISEDIGQLLALRKLDMPEELKDDFKAFLDKNIEAYQVAQRIIQQMDELLESSFGGFEAEKVKKMGEEVAFREHEADLLQQKLLKNLFKLEKKLPYSSFILWLRVLQTLGSISDLSENLGDRVRMTLDLK